MTLHGTSAAYARVVRRLLGLVLVALVVYRRSEARAWEDLKALGIWDALRVPLKRDWFQTLMHIAVTSLWILPVIRAGTSVRIGFAAACGIMAHIMLSDWFNFRLGQYCPDRHNHGGPLGFLTWTVPTIAGTVACDVIMTDRIRKVRRLLAWAVVLMVVALGDVMWHAVLRRPGGSGGITTISKLADDPVIPSVETRQNRPQGLLLAEPPFVSAPDSALRKWNYWMMSQRAGSLSYVTFAAGFSLLAYALFYVACDR